MNAIILRETTRPARAVEALVAWHGFWPVLRAVLVLALRPRVPRLADEVLSDHMRRDIGLPPHQAGHRHAPDHLRRAR